MEEEMKQVPLEFICRYERTAEVCRAAIEEDGVQKDKAVKFDKENRDFSFSPIRQERKKGVRI